MRSEDAFELLVRGVLRGNDRGGRYRDNRRIRNAIRRNRPPPRFRRAARLNSAPHCLNRGWTELYYPIHMSGIPHHSNTSLMMPPVCPAGRIARDCFNRERHDALVPAPSAGKIPSIPGTNTSIPYPMIEQGLERGVSNVTTPSRIERDTSQMQKTPVQSRAGSESLNVPYCAPHSVAVQGDLNAGGLGLEPREGGTLAGILERVDVLVSREASHADADVSNPANAGTDEIPTLDPHQIHVNADSEKGVCKPPLTTDEHAVNQMENRTHLHLNNSAQNEKGLVCINNGASTSANAYNKELDLRKATHHGAEENTRTDENAGAILGREERCSEMQARESACTSVDQGVGNAVRDIYRTRSIAEPEEVEKSLMANDMQGNKAVHVLGGVGLRANGDTTLDAMDRASLRTARLAHFCAQNLSKIDKLSLA